MSVGAPLQSACLPAQDAKKYFTAVNLASWRHGMPGTERNALGWQVAIRWLLLTEQKVLLQPQTQMTLVQLKPHPLGLKGKRHHTERLAKCAKCRPVPLMHLSETIHQQQQKRGNDVIFSVCEDSLKDENIKPRVDSLLTPPPQQKISQFLAVIDAPVFQDFHSLFFRCDFS